MTPRFLTWERGSGTNERLQLKVDCCRAMGSRCIREGVRRKSQKKRVTEEGETVFGKRKEREVDTADASAVSMQAVAECSHWGLPSGAC